MRLTHLDMNSLDFGSLKKCFMVIFNKVALLKNKSLRANHSKSVTKDVNKAIMLRTKLRNQLLKKRTLEAISRGIFVSVLSKKLSEITPKFRFKTH